MERFMANILAGVRTSNYAFGRLSSVSDVAKAGPPMIGSSTMTSEENSETVPLTSCRFNASSHMDSVLYIIRMTRKSPPKTVV